MSFVTFKDMPYNNILLYPDGSLRYDIDLHKPLNMDGEGVLLCELDVLGLSQVYMPFVFDEVVNMYVGVKILQERMKDGLYINLSNGIDSSNPYRSIFIPKDDIDLYNLIQYIMLENMVSTLLHRGYDLWFSIDKVDGEEISLIDIFDIGFIYKENIFIYKGAWYKGSSKREDAILFLYSNLSRSYQRMNNDDSFIYFLFNSLDITYTEQDHLLINDNKSIHLYDTETAKCVEGIIGLLNKLSMEIYINDIILHDREGYDVEKELLKGFIFTFTNSSYKVSCTLSKYDLNIYNYNLTDAPDTFSLLNRNISFNLIKVINQLISAKLYYNL